MIVFAPFKGEHLWEMPLQPDQAWAKEQAGSAAGFSILENEFANTVFKDGVPVLCCGAYGLWPGRALLWAYFRDGIPPATMGGAMRWAKLWLDGLPFRRLEANVRCDYGPGHRLVKMLGFTLEAERMRAFSADGTDCAMYAKVK